QSGAPLAGIRIEASGPGGQAATRVTDARGGVELRGLAPGEWKLAVRAAGYVPITREVTIRPGRVPTEVALELARGATLAGVVRDRQGRRVPGAKVSIGSVSTVTDADGNFRIVGAASGVLEAEQGGRAGSQAIELAPGAERHSLTLELE
ncbi:MAG: carboxypeptidase regulatory-like domain-containing protein, partial [Deltaproteobacteria bacterium]|nr:carboxypeptidase regulatory-like domain-containing protein [Deltaproteobacteria bacterium]